MKRNFENRLRHLEETRPAPRTILYRIGNPVCWLEIVCRPDGVIRRFFRDDGSIEESLMLHGGGALRTFAPDGSITEEVPLVGGIPLEQHPEATRASFQHDPAVQRKIEQIRDSGNCRMSDSPSGGLHRFCSPLGQTRPGGH
jgi:hypothetical protein